MALTREERKLLHQKSQQPTFGSGKPNDDDGFNGDISYRKVEGSGTVQYLKENNSWTAISSSGEMPPIRVAGGGGGGGSSSSGVTSHNDLTSLSTDDHVQYLLIDGSRAMTGDLSLGGGDGALTFTVAGENSIKIPDNQASALIIEEANTAYLTFVTTNSGEKMQFHKALDIDAVSDFGSNAMTNVNIDSGAIDGTAIGANSHSTIKGTTIDATTDFTIDGLVITADTITNDAALTVDAAGDIILDANSGVTKFYLAGDTDDLCTLTVAANGATTIATNDIDGTAGDLTLDADGDIIIDAAGYDIYFKNGGYERLRMDTDASPTLAVTGAFTIEGSASITLTSITDFIVNTRGSERMFVDDDGSIFLHDYAQNLNNNNYGINNKKDLYHFTTGNGDFSQNYTIISEYEVLSAGQFEAYPS